MLNRSVYNANETHKKIKFICLMYREFLNTIKGLFDLKKTIFEEAIVDKDTVEHLKSNLKRIPKQFDVLYNYLENDKSSEANDQKDFMISELTDIINQAESIEALVGSHKNDTTITASAFASLEKLKSLAENHKKLLEDL